ncbi:DNA damage-regulated autophagy modulator protein 2 [Elysia marginata]|uniref:DNA damage-regulated autophagy modulator protein 2 n=1 Tax=Elysia marginata TaxID=1093978 RepID=A0AAV4ECR3_9GAST|nr:DNA damage-regulated autophagy modulator protein 2 [Elysia marginata]
MAITYSIIDFMQQQQTVRVANVPRLTPCYNNPQPSNLRKARLEFLRRQSVYLGDLNLRSYVFTRDGAVAITTGKMPLMMMLLRRRLHYLPIFTAVFIISAFFLSYGISVHQGHVEPDFPYISTCLSSYTAVQAPERCVFAQLVNLGAFLLAANIYIRYLQMSEVIDLLNGQKQTKCLNRFSLALGWISAFGLTMVANFQTVEMRAVHYTGAGLAFLLGMTYCWLQTSLSVRYCRWSPIAVAQLINSIFLSACLLILLVVVSKTTFKIKEARGEGTKWDSLRGVYLTSTISEWLTAASIVTFVLTFYRDFSRVELKSPRVKINDRDIVLQDFRFGALSSSGSAVPDARQNIHAGIV